MCHLLARGSSPNSALLKWRRARRATSKTSGMLTDLGGLDLCPWIQSKKRLLTTMPWPKLQHIPRIPPVIPLVMRGGQWWHDPIRKASPGIHASHHASAPWICPGKCTENGGIAPHLVRWVVTASSIEVSVRQRF